MLAAAYGTISDIELVWTLIASIGAFYSLWNLREAIVDLRALGKIGNGRRLVAWTTLQSEIARLLVQLIFIAIGIGAMLLPDASQRDLPTRYVLYGALIRWGLIVASLLILYKSYLAHRVRKTLKQGLFTERLKEVLPAEGELHVEGTLKVKPDSQPAEIRGEL